MSVCPSVCLPAWLGCLFTGFVWLRQSGSGFVHLGCLSTWVCCLSYCHPSRPPPGCLGLRLPGSACLLSGLALGCLGSLIWVAHHFCSLFGCQSLGSSVCHTCLSGCLLSGLKVHRLPACLAHLRLRLGWAVCLATCSSLSAAPCLLCLPPAHSVAGLVACCSLLRLSVRCWVLLFVCSTAHLRRPGLLWVHSVYTVQLLTCHLSVHLLGCLLSGLPVLLICSPVASLLFTCLLCSSVMLSFLAAVCLGSRSAGCCQGSPVSVLRLANLFGLHLHLLLRLSAGLGSLGSSVSCCCCCCCLFAVCSLSVHGLLCLLGCLSVWPQWVRPSVWVCPTGLGLGWVCLPGLG